MIMPTPHLAISKKDAYLVNMRHRRDPVAWGKEVVGIRFSRQQELAVRRFVANLKPNGGTGKMLIKSGHNLGKTWLAAFIALWFVSVFPQSQVLMMSSSGTQVKERLFAEFRRMIRQSLRKVGGKLLGLSQRFEDKWSVVAVSPNNPDNFQGEHAEHILIVFDEAQAVDREFWAAMEGMIGSANGCCLGILNPLYLDGAAYENWRKPHEWELMTFNCLEHENVTEGKMVFRRAVTPQWIEDRREEWGEDSPLYQARVLGEWPDQSAYNIVTIADLERAHTGNLEDFGRYLALDVARFGDDSNVLGIADKGRIIHADHWSGLDTMKTTGRLVRAMEEYSVIPECCNVDGGGVGGGVVDRAREQGYLVNDIQFGEAPQGDCVYLPPSERFVNRRAELHWATRMALKEGRFVVPKRFGRAWADLLLPTYHFNSKGWIQVEEKKAIKKRSGRSPDWGDMVVMLQARARNASPSVHVVQGARG